MGSTVHGKLAFKPCCTIFNCPLSTTSLFHFCDFRQAYTGAYTAIAYYLDANRDSLKEHRTLDSTLKATCTFLETSGLVWFLVGNYLVWGPNGMCTESPILSAVPWFVGDQLHPVRRSDPACSAGGCVWCVVLCVHSVCCLC